LLEHGFIRSSTPEDIARFLLKTDGLSKAQIGEYMGEGCVINPVNDSRSLLTRPLRDRRLCSAEANVAVMHSFVDLLDFRNMKFVDAIRTFLQSFRLPGEAQKIDRYVLKFAERYIAGNPGTTFANADTAYILAFSVIMLNTDAHSKNIKTRRMTKEEFFKNNRGINDGNSLPDDFLGEIYDEIQTNEIKMKDEIQEPQVAAAPGLVGTLVNARRDLQRDAYVLQSEGMSNRTEVRWHQASSRKRLARLTEILACFPHARQALFKTLLRTQRRAGDKSSEQYYSASHLEHVRPMFEVAWMPFLAALSGPLQETDELDVVELCLEGFKHAIKIVCFFELELERNAFVSTLAKFTFLNNLGEMKTKNVEAIKTLLDIAVSEGNLLKKSWIDVLRCVSQLERMQLISNGIETPDLRRTTSATSSKKTQGSRASRHGPGEDVALESRSAQVTVASDMVFSSSRHLSGVRRPLPFAGHRASKRCFADAGDLSSHSRPSSNLLRPSARSHGRRSSRQAARITLASSACRSSSRSRTTTWPGSGSSGRASGRSSASTSTRSVISQRLGFAELIC
jgi:brefeldin A-inhibited guanine nucleotide-exchange protein